MRQLRVCVFGASRCGKSQLITQFTSGSFSPEYEQTIEDMYSTEINVHGRYTYLTILDTQGLELFKSMREIYTTETDAFIICYDTSDLSSLDGVEDLASQIIRQKSPSVPLVFVGTKIDKLSEYGSTNVIKAGNKLSFKFGKPHVLTSAKQKKQVTECFETLIELSRENDAHRNRNFAVDTQSTTSDVSIDGILFPASERSKRHHHAVTFKGSMLKLRNSMANIGQHKSMQNIRQAVSTVSLHRKYQPRTMLNAKGASTRHPAPLGTQAILSQPTAKALANSKLPRYESVQFVDDADHENSQRITQNQLSSLPEFEDVATSKHRDICVIM